MGVGVGVDVGVAEWTGVGVSVLVGTAVGGGGEAFVTYVGEGVSDCSDGRVGCGGSEGGVAEAAAGGATAVTAGWHPPENRTTIINTPIIIRIRT